MSNEDPPISLELMIQPQGTGTLNTVAIGISDFPTILITSEAEDDGIKFTLKTGYPFDQTIEGVEEIATFLTMFADSFKGEHFQTAWLAQIEASEVADTISTEFFDDEGEGEDA